MLAGRYMEIRFSGGRVLSPSTTPSRCSPRSTRTCRAAMRVRSSWERYFCAFQVNSDSVSSRREVGVVDDELPADQRRGELLPESLQDVLHVLFAEDSRPPSLLVPRHGVPRHPLPDRLRTGGQQHQDGVRGVLHDAVLDSPGIDGAVRILAAPAVAVVERREDRLLDVVADEKVIVARQEGAPGMVRHLVALEPLLEGRTHAHEQLAVLAGHLRGGEGEVVVERPAVAREVREPSRYASGERRLSHVLAAGDDQFHGLLILEGVWAEFPAAPSSPSGHRRATTRGVSRCRASCAGAGSSAASG